MDFIELSGFAFCILFLTWKAVTLNKRIGNLESADNIKNTEIKHLKERLKKLEPEAEPFFKDKP